MLIYFQTAFLSGGGDKFASPYMAVQKTPFSNHFEPCNPKSIKPINYKGIKVINNDYNFTSKKRKEPKVVGLVP